MGVQLSMLLKMLLLALSDTRTVGTFDDIFLLTHVGQSLDSLLMYIVSQNNVQVERLDNRYYYDILFMQKTVKF